jgi:hypothetical protein
MKTNPYYGDIDQHATQYEHDIVLIASFGSLGKIKYHTGNQLAQVGHCDLYAIALV